MNDVYGTYGKEEDGTPLLHVTFYWRFANETDRENAVAELKEFVKKIKVIN